MVAVMASEPLRDPDRLIARQALWITLGVWTMDIVFNLLPVALDGRATPATLASVVLIALVGCGLSWPVFHVMTAVRLRPWPMRYGVLVGLALTCGALNSLADTTLGGLLRDAIDPVAAAAMTPDRVMFRFVSNIFGLGWMYVLLGAFYLMLMANGAVMEHERQLADARTAAAEAEGQATAARLAALRYQLNPHFLFNTLNAVSSAVITKRNAEAEAMLEKLAEFLRVTLAADPEGMIPLEDELATIQAYLEIESVRFRDRLGVDFSCPDDLRSAVVPSFILQPLIENAIKHGVSRSSAVVTVRLEVARDGDDLVVLVEDDAERLGEPARGAGVGLKNIRQRLEALYGPRGVLQTTARERGFLAMVRLPLIASLRARKARAA